jgi:hypothetical protein
MALVLTVETSFGGNEMQLARLADYLTAISPCIETQPAAFPLFAESLTITTVALHEHFLASLVAGAAHHCQPVLREYFVKAGNGNERKIAAHCDLKTLIRLAKRRLSFKQGGARIAKMFELLFGISPWPSDEVHHAILDLILLRNIFVHEGAAVLGEHAEQAYRPGLFSTRKYADLPTIYHVEHLPVLLLLRDALVGMKAQAEYLRQRLSEQDQWQQKRTAEA